MSDADPGMTGVGRACPGDADPIARLCRRAFPGAPEWRAPLPVVRRWWRGIIRAESDPVYVARGPDGLPVGFAVDASDTAWVRAQHKGPHAKWVKALVVLAHPGIARARLRKVRKARSAAERAGHAGSDHTPPHALPGVRFLGLLLVAPDARGTGIADRLLGAVERAAAERGHQLLRVHVDARNSRGRRFYERNGYELVGFSRGSAILIKRVRAAGDAA